MPKVAVAKKITVAKRTPRIASRFQKLTQGCVRDTLTGLEWTPTLNPDEAVQFGNARELAECCELLGGDWRLPTPAELVSIVDYSRVNPAIDVKAFPCTKSGWYWTGQPRASSPSDYAWGVYFFNGNVHNGLQYGTGFVRAVRRVPASQ